MLRKKLMVLTFLLFFIGGAPAFAENLADIEVFDIAKAEVQKKVTNSIEIQKEVQHCLESITGLLEPFKEAPKEGKIIRIPLNPPILVENQWFSTLANEVFLVQIPGSKPFFIVLGENRTPYLVSFSHDPQKIMNYIMNH